MGIVFYHWSHVSVLGLFYFIGEFVVVGALIYVEFKTAFSEINPNSR
jgi:hypothetical protein